jgi:nucleotide-binding universal stress UspA family protein
MTDPAPRLAPRLARIVVALDFSEPSLRAVEWVAQHFARGTELILVHAIHVPTPPRFLAGRYPPTERLVETARTGAERRLRELVSSLATGLIWTEVRVGAPDEEIVRVAGEYGADLIVVGRPAPRAGLFGRLGTTAQRVLRRATVPVLLAAELPPRAPTRVLVGVDDSALTDPVLDWALFLAERFAAEAVVLHVVHPLDLDSGTVMTRGLTQAAADARGHPSADDPALRDAERWLEEQLERRLGATSGARRRERIVPTAVEGLAARALVDEATRRRAELVVVGSRGAGATQRFLLGSVAEAVLRESPCPVLVIVRPGDAPE